MPELQRPPDWMADAVCSQSDPEVWFPVAGGTPEPAKAICARCPVLDQCRAWSIPDWHLYGVWGGLTEHERRMAREAAKGAAA